MDGYLEFFLFGFGASLLFFAGRYFQDIVFSFLAITVGVVSLFGSQLLTVRTIGTLYEDTLDNKTYVVISSNKYSDSSEDRVLLLRDLEKKKNRVAELSSYPPAGYREVRGENGAVFLYPVN